MAILKIRDENGNIIEIPALKGDKGDSYILTENDKAEIANQVSGDFVQRSDIVDNLVADGQPQWDKIPNGTALQTFIEKNAVSSAKSQDLTPTKKGRARKNIGAVSYLAPTNVEYDMPLTPDEMAQARTNINAAKKTGDWEKLYEITTDGATKKWEISAFADGDALALTSLGVKVIATNPVSTEPSNATITLSGKYIDNGVEGLNVRVPLFNILSTTENLVAVATINNDRGIWLTKFCKAVANKASQTSAEDYIPNNLFTYNGVEHPVINTIVLTGAVPLAAGNTIEIWGVRA